MDWMDEVIRGQGRVCLSAAAVHLVMVAREDAETMRAVRSTVTVPDGMPLVWALRALGHRGASRVYGPDLMAAYCARAARTGTPMYLYGGRSEDAREQLERALGARYPGLRIAGGWSPPFRDCRRPQAGCSATAWSGPTGCRASRAACGGATRATTRASSPRSPASTPRTAAGASWAGGAGCARPSGR
jgi:UDP-N-acetyl-D-mannosaminuronic acid transferase (WecB/TagA/CpsF family)